MTEPPAESFAHESHMQRAFELAREVVARGDHPFGSVLVSDDEIVMEASNRVNTADDLRRHPELELAYRATQEFAPEERATMVMYTSTEPCPMCAGGMRTAAFDRVLYSVSAPEITNFTGGTPKPRASDILDGITDVTGPVLNEDGRQLHQDFDW